MNVRLNSRVMLFVCLGLGWSGEGWSGVVDCDATNRKTACYFDCDGDGFHTITPTCFDTNEDCSKYACPDDAAKVGTDDTATLSLNDCDDTTEDSDNYCDCYHDCDGDSEYAEDPQSIPLAQGMRCDSYLFPDNADNDKPWLCSEQDSSKEQKATHAPGLLATDCNDDDIGINNTETSESVGANNDANCDGKCECYADSDGDGYGNSDGNVTTVTIKEAGGLCGCDSSTLSTSSNNNDCEGGDEDKWISPVGYWIIDDDGDGWPVAIYKGCPPSGTVYEDYVPVSSSDKKYSALGVFQEYFYSDGVIVWDSNKDGVLDPDSDDCKDDPSSHPDAAKFNPGESEDIKSATDLDCSGGCLAYEDGDGDGYAPNTLFGGPVECVVTVTEGGVCADGIGLNKPCGSTDHSARGTGDCNNNDSARHPGITSETCESSTSQLDDDCDESVHTYTASGISYPASGSASYYFDGDRDGFGGDPNDYKPLCLGGDPNSFYTATQPGDCNDDPEGGSQIHPNRIETCSTDFDDDCDGFTNEPWQWTGIDAVFVDNRYSIYELESSADVKATIGCNEYFLDADYDGQGSSSAELASLCLCDETPNEPEPTTGCSAKDGLVCTEFLLDNYAATDAADESELDNLRILYDSGFAAGYAQFSKVNTDCDDDDDEIFQRVGQPEVLDGKDSDCSGSIPIAEFDCDMDGYIVGDLTQRGLSLGRGYTRDEGCTKEQTEPIKCRRSPSSDTWIETERFCEARTIEITPRTPSRGGFGGLLSSVIDPVLVFAAQWVIRTDDPTNADLLISGTKRNGLPVDVGDCDDLCASRHPGREEVCDGLDNDCSLANGSSCTLEHALTGACVGTVCEDEADPDGDGAITCASDEEMVCALDGDGGEEVVTMVSCDDTAAIPRGDTRGYCTRSTPYTDEEDIACDGIRSATKGVPYPGEVDADGDRHYACGPREDYTREDDGGTESVFVLALFAVDSAYEGAVNSVPMLYPRAAPGGGVLPSDAVLATRLLDELMKVPDYTDSALAPILKGQKVAATDGKYTTYDPLLDLCIRAEICATAGASGVSPGFCGDGTASTVLGRCAIVEMKLSKDGLFEPAEEDDDVNGEDMPADFGEVSDRIVQSAPIAGERSGRLVWSQSRIVESRRRVVEWDCFLTRGTYGCGNLDSGMSPHFTDDLLDLFTASTLGGERDFTAPVQYLMTDARWWKELGRFDVHHDVGSSVSEILLGCWGDPTANADLSISVHDRVGGDCRDGDGRDEPSTHRDALEGPDDVLGLLTGQQVDCDTCEDGLDNNCDGLTDCEDPGCAPCWVGQGGGSGGCSGADPEAPCGSSGGCSAGRGVRSPWPSLGELGLLLLAALGLPLYRRGVK